MNSQQFSEKIIITFFESKKSDKEWSGRTSQNAVAVFPKEHYKVGDLVNVKIHDCTSATLIGNAIGYSGTN